MKKNIVRLNESQLRSLVKKSVKRVLMEMKESLESLAREMYEYVDNWESEVVDEDGGYATGYMYGSVEDENGGVWEFEADCGFNWEGDWEIDYDSIENITFTAPDGTTGSI